MRDLKKGTLRSLKIIENEGHMFPLPPSSDGPVTAYIHGTTKGKYCICDWSKNTIK